MATYFTEQIELLVKQLVLQVTKLEESSETFKCIEAHVKRRLLEADSMVFSNRDDVDRAIASFADKFIFHNFFDKAEQLKRAYEKYMAISKSDLISRLNVVKFLMCMSHSPTKKFEEAIEESVVEDEDEISDWGAFLKEGIEKWVPESDSEDSEWSTDSVCSSPTQQQLNENSQQPTHLVTLSTTSNVTSLTAVDDFQTAKENLLSHIQNGWFNTKYYRELPESEWPEANTVIRWEHHLEVMVRDLIPIPKSSIISEYKVMREILWQLWEPHESFVFYLNRRNQLRIKPNVTISSVRLEAFENYLEVFLPHIELIKFFTEFLNTTNNPNTPDTYRSYSDGVNSILKMIKEKLIELERKVTKQEASMTLIKLEKEIRTILKPLTILKQIHKKIIVNLTENTTFYCATHLLVKLHENLLHSHSKLHQDLSLTLYLNSIYKYLWIIENWLTEDNFQDGLNEFPIINNNSNDFVGCLYKSTLETLNNTIVLNGSATERLKQDWQMEFELQEMCEEIKNDGFIRIVCEQVLGMGKNVHLLHLLGKLHLVGEAAGICNSETVHEEFLRKVLEEIRQHFNIKQKTPEIKQKEMALQKNPIICPDDCKKITDWDRLENLVDIEDGFFMKAFQPFLIEPKPPEQTEQPTLFQEISSITDSLFPAQNLIENTLVDILNRRFKTSGQIVKNLLLTENNLERHFEFLIRVYLFKDDFLFFFYQRLFRQFDFTAPLEHYTRLTSFFRDQIMDVYPEFCDSCTVKTEADWKNCRDSLTALHLISIRFVVKWPINIIIRMEHLEMYYEIFEFNMKIKWALHTLGHLSFNDIPNVNKTKARKILLRKLQVLRFKLLNIFSTIQRYIFGYIYPMNWRIFEVELDRSHDVNSMMNTHGVFITTIYENCMELKNYKSNTYGFQTLLHLVNKLAMMWNNKQKITDEELENMDLCYRECVNSIDHFVIPTYYVL